MARIVETMSEATGTETTPTTTTSEPLRTRAEQLLGERVDLVTRLGEAAQRATDARAALREAEKAEAAAWSAATDGGWSKNELQQLGFTAPATRRGGRPSRSKRGKRGNHEGQP